MSAINLSSDTKSWKRIMLKLSGEALVGKQKYGLDPEKIASISKDISNVYKQQKEIVL